MPRMQAAPAMAGAPESAPAGSATARTDVFISYSRRDKAFVEGTLLTALVARDKDVWIDLADIPPASDWRERVMAGVSSANAVVFVLSPDSLASPVCMAELDRAVELNKRIVPVLRRDLADAPVPPELARSNWVYLRDGDDADRGLALVVEALETDLEWRDAHSRLSVRTSEWIAGGQNRSFLLRGMDLSAAESWLAGQDEHAERPTAEQSSYIAASRQATSRRQRITMTAVLFALAVASTLAVYALIKRGVADERAKVASSRELAAQALSVLPRDPELSVLLASAGAHTHATAQAEDVLRRSLGESHVVLTMRGHRGPVADAVFADHDRLVVTAGHDRTVRVWDARTGRPLSVMRGHTGIIRGLAVSPDSRRILTTSEDGTARLWDRARGQLVAVLRGHRGWVVSPGFSPDGRTLLTASTDGTARLWDAKTGRSRAELLGHQGPLLNARFNRAGDRVVTTGVDGTARLWASPSGFPIAAFVGHRGWVNGATFSPNGRLVATAGADGTARIFSVVTGRQLKLLPVGSYVGNVDFSRDSKRVATSGRDGTAAVWDVRTGKRTAELRGHQDVVSRARFSRDGALVITSSDDDTVRIWDSRSGQPVASLLGHTDIAGGYFSADGARVVTSSDDGTARIWSLPARVEPFPSDAAGLTAAALSPDGSRVVTWGESGALNVFDAHTRKPLLRFGPPELAAQDAAFLPGGRLAIGTLGGKGLAAEVVDVRSGRVLATMRAVTALTRRISVSRDGTRAVTIGTPPDRTVRVWDTATGRLVSSFDGKGDSASADLSPDGSRVIRGVLPREFLARAAAGDYTGGAIESWNATTGKLVATLDIYPGAGSGASFSPDGRRAILVTAEGSVPIWSMRSSKPDRVVRPRAQAFLDQLVSVDWSPDGKLGAAADRNARGVVRVIDVDRGTVVRELRHGARVTGVSFSRDGRWIVTSGIDGVARVWDASTGSAIAELRGSASGLISASFGPDAREVLTASSDGAARLHSCEVCASVAQLQKLVPDHISAGRRLTRLERSIYLHASG